MKIVHTFYYDSDSSPYILEDAIEKIEKSKNWVHIKPKNMHLNYYKAFQDQPIPVQDVSHEVCAL